MLRPDFPEIFDYLTKKATTYGLNTNGTLITPEIAKMLKRKGSKMIALYGATAKTYDRVVRNQGGFEMAMRGFRYMQEAGAAFIVQLIPMQENWHEWSAMLDLAKVLSPHWRVGAPWLYKTACANRARNAEIERQRLSPSDVIELDPPELAYGERMEEILSEAGTPQDADSESHVSILHSLPFDASDDRLFASCIAIRRNFYIDPYGQMTFCSYIKDPTLQYDLRHGTLQEAWETFIPSLADKVRGGNEYHENCGNCEKRTDCHWCAVYARLETGRYSARVPYLCAVADEARAFRADWQARHRRYFRIAGITVRVESDVDFNTIKFKDELMAFAVDGPGDDNVTLRHFFELPRLKSEGLGKELYHKVPWAISQQKDGTWIYRGINSESQNDNLHRAAVFDAHHLHGNIYNPPGELENIRKNGWPSLSLFPTDQIWLAPLLAKRHAVLLHSAAASLNGQGLVFIGHSNAGKSTTMEMLKAADNENLHVEILCDDRNVVRKWNQGSTEREWQVHGTWSHGTTTDVSNAAAPLRAILFLQKDNRNEIVPLTDRKEIWRLMLATLIRSVVTAEWWQEELNILDQIVNELPCYTMYFDKSGVIVTELQRLCTGRGIGELHE